MFRMRLLGDLRAELLIRLRQAADRRRQRPGVVSPRLRASDTARRDHSQRKAAGRASPAPPGSRPTGRTEGRSRQMLSSRHLPRRWQRRYGFGKVGTRTLPFGAKRQRSPQNGQAARGSVGLPPTRRRRFAVTASRKAAQWLANIAKRRDAPNSRNVDVRDYPIAVLRGREIADVSAAEERNLVAPGASRSLQCWKIWWWAKVLKAGLNRQHMSIAVRS